MIPFKCEICGRQFGATDEYAGGLCSSCNKTVCFFCVKNNFLYFLLRIPPKKIICKNCCRESKNKKQSSLASESPPFKKEDYKMIKKLPLIFASVHFILVIVFSIIILIWLKFDKEAGMAWSIFAILDCPISLVLMSEWTYAIWTPILNLPIIKTIPETMYNLIIPFIYFGIFGTVQYYIWGFAISKILLFLKNKMLHSNSKCNAS